MGVGFINMYERFPVCQRLFCKKIVRGADALEPAPAKDSRATSCKEGRKGMRKRVVVVLPWNTQSGGLLQANFRGDANDDGTGPTFIQSSACGWAFLCGGRVSRVAWRSPLRSGCPRSRIRMFAGATPDLTKPARERIRSRGKDECLAQGGHPGGEGSRSGDCRRQPAGRDERERASQHSGAERRGVSLLAKRRRCRARDSEPKLQSV